jgi:hypothetical protein
VQNRICLWSGPRSISTALMYSFSSRKDTIVFDEPLYAHYLKATGKKHPGYNEVMSSYHTDGNKVVDDVILRRYEKPISFFKLMSHFIINLDLCFLAEVKNIILLRNPLEIISSYHKVIKNPTLNDIGILDQFKLFNFFKKNDIPFIVVDSQDILISPEKTLKDLCRELSISFDKNMLKWNVGPKKIDGIWSKYWYSGVHNTTSFSSPSKKNIKLSSNNELIYKEALKYYKIIKELKI